MDPKMSNDEVLHLVNNYKKLECLWNFRSPKYKYKDLRNRAWVHLAKLYNKDVDEIKKKIKYLRSAYVNEKRKVDESKLSGAAGEELYRPKLFYYDDLDFLDSVIVSRQGLSIYGSKSLPHMELEEVEEEIDIKDVQPTDYCMEYVAVPSPSPSLSTSTQDKQEIQRLSPSSCASFKIETSNEPNTYSTQSSEHDSLYLAFGKTIAMQLGQLTPLEANSTMDVIHRLVSRDVMRSMLARSKPISSTSYKYPYLIKRKRQTKNKQSEQLPGHRNFVID